MKDVDISELDFDSRIEDVDGFGDTLTENLTDDGIETIRDISCAALHVDCSIEEYLMNNIDGIGGRRSKKLRNIAKMVGKRNERERKSDQTSFGIETDGLEVVLLASENWTKKRRMRPLVSRVEEAIDVVSRRFNEKVTEMYWLEGSANKDPDNGHPKHEVFENAADKISNQSSHPIAASARSIPWSDLPDEALKQWKYSTPTDHPEVREYESDDDDSSDTEVDTVTNTDTDTDSSSLDDGDESDKIEFDFGKTVYAAGSSASDSGSDSDSGDDEEDDDDDNVDTSNMYWIGAIDAAKKKMFTDADVVIVMNNHKYIRSTFRLAGKHYARVYVHEVEKHHLDDDLTNVPSYVTAVKKDDRETDERFEKGRDSPLEPQTFSEIPDFDYSIFEDEPHAGTVSFKPIDSDEQHENPYAPQKATLNEEKFDGHKRKRHKDRLDGYQYSQ